MSARPCLFASPQGGSTQFIPFSRVVSTQQVGHSSLVTGVPPSPTVVFFIS